MDVKYALILLIFPTLSYAGTTEKGQMVSPPSKNIKIMRAQTEETANPFVGMAEAQNFTSNPSNKCGVSTGNHCFVQLTTARIGDATTQGTNSCPQDFSPIMSFGNKVYAVSNNQQVVFMQGDAHARVGESEKTFYEANGYSCGADSGASLVSERLDRSRQDENEIKKWMLTIRYVNSSYLYLNSYKYWGRTCRGPAGVTLADWSCTSSAGTGHWEYMYDLYGYPIKCTRNAGFWQINPSNPKYPLAAAGVDFTPTTVICAKSFITWKEKR